MKRFLILSLLLSALAFSAPAQRHGPGYYNARIEVINGDTIPVIDMMPVCVFGRPADMRKYAKLVRNVKIVYPIAKEAKAKLAVMEEELLKIGNRNKQRAYIRQVENEIKKEYTPVLRRMTMSQGKILIKLIDRETDKTSYELVRELRGGFSAVFWQGIAKIFGANLKDQYDKTGEDKVIEQIIILYEAGLI